jgi:diphosphomevalonate decarboxylase
MAAVRGLRQAGTLAYFTMDAGPHVKVLTRSEDEPAVTAALLAVPGVERVIPSGPGEGARIVDEAG